MRRSVPTILLALPMMPAAAAPLFFEDFEDGAATTSFVLNVAENGSQTDAASSNKWIINNVYAGGTASLVCLGFPFTYTVGGIMAQPMGQIVDAPNSHYLHILADEAEMDGILNANFAPADDLCNFSSNNFARMSSDVNTTYSTNVTLRFWWLGGGNPGTVYGEVYYSIDAGASWILITTPIAQYQGFDAWSLQTITLPAWEGQPTLRFGFRFVNGTTTAATTVGFSIDDVSINATPIAVFADGFE